MIWSMQMKGVVSLSILAIQRVLGSSSLMAGGPLHCCSSDNIPQMDFVIERPRRDDRNREPYYEDQWAHIGNEPKKRGFVMLKMIRALILYKKCDQLPDKIVGFSRGSEWLSGVKDPLLYKKHELIINTSVKNPLRESERRALLDAEAKKRNPNYHEDDDKGFFEKYFGGSKREDAHLFKGMAPEVEKISLIVAERMLFDGKTRLRARRAGALSAKSLHDPNENERASRAKCVFKDEKYLSIELFDRLLFDVLGSNKRHKLFNATIEEVKEADGPYGTITEEMKYWHEQLLNWYKGSPCKPEEYECYDYTKGQMDAREVAHRLWNILPRESYYDDEPGYDSCTII
ncbi:hypothetical protein ENBRE01_1177 [Enteropsectra breve]|nr:hypothetical protein ENBRE01_1177 [Enteropsectra breve]